MEIAAALLFGIGTMEYLLSPGGEKEKKENAIKKLYEVPESLTNQEIVDKILDGSIPPIDYKNFDYKVVSEPLKGTSLAKSKEFVDETRELKDICTDIVVNLFLESSKSNFNFLKKVYETFNDAINYYQTQRELPAGSLILVYKGGNVLRIISNEFLRELPGSAAFDIQEYYKNFFKRSDADFSVYVDPNLESYDRIYNDMILLGFILQRRLREEFMSNKTDYFDFYKYNHDYKAHILEPYFKKMKSVGGINDPKNKTLYKKRVTTLVFEDIVLPNNKTDVKRPKYVVQPDKGIQYSNKDTIVRFVIPNESTTDNSIYVQSNETLDFEAGGKVKFALVRSKFDFNIYFADEINLENILTSSNGGSTGNGGTSGNGSGNGRSNGEMRSIGGELIDLSFPHRLDAKLGHFFEHINKYLHKYELHSNDATIQFNSYSLIYLVEDLEFILFKFVQKPWDAPKYEKRVNRLFYLYMIDIFNKIKTNPDRKKILESFTDLFNELMATNNVSDMKDIIDDFESENEEKHRHLLINNLVFYIKGLTEIMTARDIPNFRDFLMVLLENAKIIINSFRNLGEYCSIDGSIRLKNIYDGDLRSLV